MALLRMVHDCSAVDLIAVTDAAGQPLLDEDGHPVLRPQPALPHLMEMTPEEEAAHLAHQAESSAQVAGFQARQHDQAAALDGLKAHALANPEDPTALLARALGIL